MHIEGVELATFIEAYPTASTFVDKRFDDFLGNEPDDDVPAYSASLDLVIRAFEAKFGGCQWLRKSPGTITVYRPVETGWATHHDGVHRLPAMAMMAAIVRAVYEGDIRR